MGRKDNMKKITTTYEKEYELQMDYWLNEGYGYEMADYYAKEYATDAMFTAAITKLKTMKWTQYRNPKE